MIGDLMVVEQRLLRYDRGEVAHIENVMQTESRERKHRRLRRTEEMTFFAKETSEESERDLQSTERFELQQESERTIQDDAQFKAGVTVSGGFGPVRSPLMRIMHHRRPNRRRTAQRATMRAT